MLPSTDPQLSAISLETPVQAPIRSLHALQSTARTSNSYLKFRTSLVRPDVLILDDLGMRKFSAQEAEDLRDVIEHRSYGKSTVITTQLPADHWSEVMGDEIIRDALIERLQPASNTILMQGPGYRAESAKKVDKGALRK